MSVKNVFILLLSAALFFACGKNEQKAEKGKDTASQQKIGQNNSGGQSGLSVRALHAYPQSKNSLPTAILEKFLPSKISGMEKSAGSQGTQNWKNALVTTVSAPYLYDGGGLLIYITDYGNIGNVPDYEINEFRKFSQDDQPGYRKVAIQNGLAFSKILDASRSGVFYALVAQRFHIKIDATNLISKYNDLKDIYFLINTDELIKAAEINK